MRNGQALLPEDFEDETFAKNNSALFDEYIDLCVKGYEDFTAMRIVFGEETVSDGGFIARNFALKRNPYFKLHYAKRLQSIKLDELWNPRLAIQILVGIARSSPKDSARINAVRELNVITGITVMDEAGNTKMGRSMDDFYRQVEKSADSLYPPATDATKH